MNNLCEYLRRKSVTSLFQMQSMQKAWEIWPDKIHQILGKPPYSPSDIIQLGDHLSEIFLTTSEEGRGQGVVSAAGAAWEGLVCWYMNLCLLGSRGVVIKHSKPLIPSPIAHAITVKYNNFKSNTESDLVGIIFPDHEEYTCNIQDLKNYRTTTGVPAFTNENLNYKELVDELLDRDFSQLEVCIIQCKTNWNDNAQIPMLWDMIYRTKEFLDTGIVVGNRSYSIRDLERFSYCFATVPTVKNAEKLKATATKVQRVKGLTGGNYWGLPSKDAVAESIAEIFSRNFHTASDLSLRATLANALKEFEYRNNYFKI